MTKLGTKWLLLGTKWPKSGYEMIKVGTKWLGYEMTWVRNNWKPSCPGRCRTHGEQLKTKAVKSCNSVTAPNYKLLLRSRPCRVIVITEPRHDKTNKMSVHPAKVQISLGIRPVWSESSLCAQWVAKDPIFLHADSEDSDQTGRMLRWTHSHFVGFVMSRLICLFGNKSENQAPCI